MTNKTPLVLITLLVTLAALANLARFFWDISLSIGPVVLPGWTGGIFFIVLALLAAWSFKALKK